ncbi:hypothetical protein FAZ19_16090 [Sphingobacterium alkalisoli]|uniref:Uncharacterized protein n=1 Tax=Sphingobacterium alkalisoli TaxID=1874115 RepID=A0A4U0GXM4_9SPHI|nr:hypothetical protein [Sphingobacterium alkalisoli]TJY63786.1 hypothetical protein FAZ19_16090 [Sphingobacterium alkalisoli]GGH24888.1 hypothetical protein GCM10011418_33120 [Sphingobacterium alkalisoli]
MNRFLLLFLVPFAFFSCEKDNTTDISAKYTIKISNPDKGRFYYSIQIKQAKKGETNVYEVVKTIAQGYHSEKTASKVLDDVIVEDLQKGQILYAEATAVDGPEYVSLIVQKNNKEVFNEYAAYPQFTEQVQ